MKMKLALLQKGYSLAEVLVVALILIVLISVASINLLSSQRHVTLQSNLQVLIADIKQQQTKAMIGDTEGRSSADYYGIHFGTSSYTLFHGTTYNQNDSTNLTIQLDTTFKFINVTLPGNNLIFIPLNGEVYEYSNVTNSLTLQDTTNSQQKTLQFNYLGVITSIN